VHDAKREIFDAIEMHQSILQNIPVYQRQERSKEGFPLGDIDSDNPIDEKILDVRDAISRLDSRLLVYPEVRPYGLQDAVIKEVADLAAQHLGSRLRPSYVKQCWKDYRSFLRDLRRQREGGST
jgi:hypothetical protein